ncbi:biliverdin-producing heme oxygenase [Bradyrhizobium lablabi]|uniref:biliverdin-producing heme oxygenase n=1 Tax=Bradyrhizobium lablabi TaxID=722472 RepID=UPI001BACD2F6|nr:biliverdin-producing heme oxygenase [Bradyrhizobium lablabi]MBR1123494.1 biliverdin-producing heme oxygenase [Bradyrhizobium lablabi]
MHALRATSDTNESSRAKRLKDATHETHDRLDKSIMAQRPFESQARYGLFLKVQHEFHREIAGLYASPLLDRLLPDLAKRGRFGLIEQDLADLGIAAPSSKHTPTFANSAALDVPTAFGWLYVSEGSNLGAAFLLKAAQQLGLSEAFGARHLAAAPEGRGLHWKTFTAALDAVVLTGPEEERVTVGARTAFARVESLVSQFYAG